MSRRLLRRAILPLVVLVAAAACDSPASQPLASPAGSYTLVAVNGAKLPATISTSGGSTVVYGGSLDLSADGAAVTHHTLGAPPVDSRTGAPVSSSGNWAANGVTVQLTLHGGDIAGVFSATYSAGVLTVTVDQGRVEKFTK